MSCCVPVGPAVMEAPSAVGGQRQTSLVPATSRCRAGAVTCQQRRAAMSVGESASHAQDGGMPPSAPVRTRTLLEVACDESGSEGEKLVRGSTHVFAHASVDVTTERALETIERVRVEARSPATEVKASV